MPEAIAIRIGSVGMITVTLERRLSGPRSRLALVHLMAAIGRAVPGGYALLTMRSLSEGKS